MSLDKGRERVGIQTLVPFIPGLPVRPGGPEEPWEEKKEGMKTGKLAKDELLGVGVGVGVGGTLSNLSQSQNTTGPLVKEISSPSLLSLS